MKHFLFLISVFVIFGCGYKIKLENKVLIIARRSDEPVASKSSRGSFKYYWNKKLYKDSNPFDALYSKQYDYFLIFIDRTDPYAWLSYNKEDYGYADTTLIPDSLRQNLFIDSSDFSLLEKEH